MRKNRNDKQQGFVTEIKSYPAKFGGFCHRISLRNKFYNIYNDSDLCLLKVGDLIEFEFYKTRKRRPYNKIDENTLKINNPVEISSITEGYVYILKNPSMPGLYKIGCTTRTPEERAAELYYQATGVPTKFEVEWSLAIAGDPYIVEQKVHAILSKKRTGKEFFKVKVDDAIKIVSEISLELYPNRSHIGKLDNIINLRKSGVEQRRAALVIQHEQKIKEAERIKQKKEYEQSDEYKWLTRGQVELSLGRKLKQKKISGGFFEKIFKQPHPDWFEATILIHKKDKGVLYSLIIRRSSGWDYSEFRPDINQDAGLTDMVKILYHKWAENIVENAEIKILINNSCVENIKDFKAPLKYWENIQINSLNEVVIAGYPKDFSMISYFSGVLTGAQDRYNVDKFLNIFFD